MEGLGREGKEQERRKNPRNSFCGARDSENEVVQTIYITLSRIGPIRLPPEPNFRFVFGEREREREFCKLFLNGEGEG